MSLFIQIPQQERCLIVKQYNGENCILHDNNEELKWEGLDAKPLACVSLAGPDLISQDTTLSQRDTDAASMHNRRRSIVPKDVGQSAYLSPGTYQAPLLAFMLYTQTYRHEMQKSPHKKRNSPPYVLHHLHAALAICSLRSCLVMRQGVNVTRLTSCRGYNEVLFYHEAIKGNSESLCQSWKCMHVPRPTLTVVHACIHKPHCVYVQCVCEHVCRIKDEHLRSSETSRGYLLHIHVFPHMWPSTVNKEY